MNISDNERFAEFKESGKACFNCDRFLTCDLVKATAGLKCSNYKSIQPENNNTKKGDNENG